MMKTNYALSLCGENPLGLYSVREGDTIQSVCAAHGVPPSLLISENKLKEFPPPGSMLVLPRAGKVYVVQPGETLDSLCEKFGVGKEEFARQNGCSYVYPTQCVLIPEPAK